VGLGDADIIKNFNTVYYRLKGPTWSAISLSPFAVWIIEVRFGIARLLVARGNAGKASGTRTPRREITMAPLIKSWANAIGLCGFTLYLEARKDRSIKANPPKKIQGNQACILDEGWKKYALR
jgi:hypothetical protein